MANYCVRCGHKAGLLKSLSLQGDVLCDNCLGELGFPVNLKTKDHFRSMSATYEILLAEARFNDPTVLDKKPGERLDDDYQQPSPTPNVRSFEQILDEDYLVDDVKIKLNKFEKCYYYGFLTVSVKSQQTVVKGGGGYKGVSINLGHGLRYSVGGKEPVKTTTKEVTLSSNVDFYLTSEKIVMVIKKKRNDYPYGFIDDISWGIKSFDIIQGDEKVNISTLILPVDKIKRIYYLIEMMRKEKELEAEAAMLKTSKASKVSRTKKQQTSEVDEKDPISLVREFKKLLDDGIITQDEFEAKKKELLKL